MDSNPIPGSVPYDDDSVNNTRKEEISLLKCIQEFKKNTGEYPFNNSEKMTAFCKDVIGTSGVDVVSKKIKELRERFQVNLNRSEEEGESVHDAQIFKLSSKIWEDDYVEDSLEVKKDTDDDIDDAVDDENVKVTADIGDENVQKDTDDIDHNDDDDENIVKQSGDVDTTYDYCDSSETNSSYEMPAQGNDHDEDVEVMYEGHDQIMVHDAVEILHEGDQMPSSIEVVKDDDHDDDAMQVKNSDDETAGC
ncbi:hypothetical protein L6452_40782 [Arctium lappa]|uniref:Uncharacterized protein n=1 Tax=Arctium lappa TaxID=4217 RepID=A0ACB8XPK2_ARCLA|nr:hypothetical protein L6452_40782 [Arctium lappa]